MYRFFAIISFICLSNETHLFGQINFPIPPIIREGEDTTFYELSHSNFYSYFRGNLDSIFIEFEDVLFDQVAAIHSESGHGYFKVKYKDHILLYYEVRNSKIEGLGLMYSYYPLKDSSSQLPFAQSMFRGDRLDGVTLIFDNQGIVSEMLLYRKGKYKKHMYHHKAKTKEAVKKGNRYTKDPFKVQEIIRLQH